MSELKGRKNKKWSKEDRVRIVKRYFDEHIGIRTLSKEENMSKHTLRHWILRYFKPANKKSRLNWKNFENFVKVKIGTKTRPPHRAGQKSIVDNYDSGRDARYSFTRP